MTTASTYYRCASMPASSLTNRRQLLTPTTYAHTGYSSNLQDYRRTGRIFSRSSVIHPSSTLLCDSRDTSIDISTRKIKNNLPAYQTGDQNLPLEKDAGRYKNDSNVVLKYRKTHDISKYRNGQNNEIQRQGASSLSSHLSSKSVTHESKRKQSNNYAIEKKASYSSKQYNANALERSRLVSLKGEDKIISQTPEPVSKLCRFSKYVNFVQTPFSTLERSISNKKMSDAVKYSRKTSEIVPNSEIHVPSTQHVENENTIRRSKTAPVQSTQQRKLDKYLVWQQEQQEKRKRLERYLKLKPQNEEPKEMKFINEHQGYKGSLRVDSPLYFVYRTPTPKRKLSTSVLKVQEKNDEKTTKPNKGHIEINDVSEKHSNTPSRGTNEQTNTSSVAATKEVVPRELIEARSAFNTIKNYCNTLIRGSAKNTTSNRDEKRKNTVPLNFFAKPVVDRPISIP